MLSLLRLFLEDFIIAKEAWKQVIALLNSRNFFYCSYPAILWAVSVRLVDWFVAIELQNDAMSTLIAPSKIGLIDMLIAVGFGNICSSYGWWTIYQKSYTFQQQVKTYYLTSYLHHSRHHYLEDFVMGCSFHGMIQFETQPVCIKPTWPISHPEGLKSACTCTGIMCQLNNPVRRHS
jgi:hypothetical protein